MHATSYLALFVFLTSLCVISHALKLELASVLFRHGDRSPTHTYPKDEYQETFWPQGFGQLSIEGMRQEYFLGEILRDRYVETEFIHPNYTRVQVYVRSTDYDRTLMSAESLLAALFPPGDNQMFNSTIPWQPIPVHTVPQEEDMLLLAFSVDCPTYKSLREADTKTQAYMDLEEENKDFFQSLEEDTGFEAVNLSNIHSIHGTLFVEQTKNLTLPNWVKPGLMDRLLNLTLYTSGLMFNSLTKKQLTAGNFVGKVLDDLKAKKNGSEKDIKIYFYSAHDTTVAAILTALGVFNGELPPYAATFITELYSDDSEQYWISLFYRNETDSDYLIPLNVASCANTTLCTLEEFIKFASPLVPADWENKCGLSYHTSSNSGPDTVVIALAALLGASVLLLLILSAGCVAMLCRTRKHRYAYTRVSGTEES